jgi:uncharacterized protein (TIGR02145 family)
MTPTDKQNLWNAILKLNNKPYIGSGYPAYNNVKNPALRGGLYTWKYRDMRNLFNEIVKYCELGQSEAVWRVLLSYKTKIYPAYLRQIYQSLSCGAVQPITTVGTQVWSTKNLNVATYRNGDPIPFATNQSDWDNYAANQIGAYRYYNDDPTTETIYGKWYNSYAVQDVRNLAPTGYHIPTIGEWETLDSYLSSQGQLYSGLKDVILNVWTAPNTDAANLYDFEIVPGGSIGTSPTGSYNMSDYAYYWTYVQNPVQPGYTYFGYDGGYAPYAGYTVFGFGLTARIISDASLTRGQLFGGGILLDPTIPNTIVGWKIDQGKISSYGRSLLPNGGDEEWGCAATFRGAGDPQDGYSNTQIMSTSGCNTISQELTGGSIYYNGYNDWYVPASDEVLMQVQQVPEYEAMLDPYVSYWTSTEANSGEAFALINPTNNPGGANWIIKTANKLLILPFLGMRKQTL